MADPDGSNEDLLLLESANAHIRPVTETSEQSISNEFMSISSGMPGNIGDEDDVEMVASLMAMDGEPTGQAVIEPVDIDIGIPALTPPLPVVDYHRKLGSPVAQWSPLPPGLEVEGEKDIIWPITDWSNASQQQILLSPPTELCGFNWQLMLYPLGTEEVRNRAVSAYIKAAPLNASDDWHSCARIIISIRNAKDETIVVTKDSQHRFEPTEPDWGFNQFTTPRCLITGDSTTGHKALLSDDKLVVVGRVQVIKDPTGMLWHSFVNYDSKKATGCVGFLNQGATCYMNSLLQSLYMTNLLRKATYKIPTDQDKPTESIALALQRTFYRLQTSNAPVGTTELTKSFGWDSVESFMQHDVHEFNRVLLDELESKMKKTEVEGMVQKLFTGRVKNVRKCLNVDFESSREEDFYDVQLTIRGMRNLKESFEAYIKPEYLTEDNKYFTEEHGYQDAKMFCIFERFPPVLHLHLERYTFDPMTGNTIKINDRLEFPTKINLDAYLSETADKSVPQEYTLHSVLVHGGDSHGGHYCAFIKIGEKWFKFDDTKVIQVTEREAVEDNYGVSSDDNIMGTADGELVRLPSWNKVQRFKRITNAYMLVYIRDADFDKVMAPVSDSDVPAYISQGIRRDEEAEERRRAEKYEIMNALHVSLFTDEMLRSYAGPDFFNLTNRALPFSQYESIRARKSDSIAEFKASIAQEMGLSPENLRLWTFSSRRNHTTRLDSPVIDEDKTLGQLISGTRMQSQLNLYLEVSTVPFEEVNRDSVMIMVKYFDREQESLRALGNVLLSKNDQIKTVIDKVAPLLGIDPTSFGEETLEFFEEIKAQRIDPLIPSNSFDSSRMGTGDIVLLQRRYDEDRLASVIDYFHELSQQVVVCFKPYVDETASRKRSSEDVALPTIEPSKEIQHVFSFEAPFSELLLGVAKHFGNVNPTFIRLHIEDPKTGRFYPMKSLERPDLTLYQAIVTASPISMTQRDTVTELTFAVEVLPCTLEELESMKPVNVHFARFKGVNETESVEVYIPFDASLLDLINRLPSPFKELVDHTKQYRLVEVQGHKIHRDYSLDDLLSTVPDSGNVYLFPIDEEQETADCKLVNVTRYWRDITRPHSLPFIFALHPAEQWSDTRKRLLTYAGITKDDTPVSVVSFGLARPISDDEVLYDRLDSIIGSNRIANTDSLAIEMNETSASTPNRFQGEKSIRIRSSTPSANAN